MQKESLLETIYLDREQDKLAGKNEYEKEVSFEIKRDGNEEKLRELIDTKIYNKKLCKKLNYLLDSTFEDFLKMESSTLDKYYKQGFKDGINLIVECLQG